MSRSRSKRRTTAGGGNVRVFLKLSSLSVYNRIKDLGYTASNGVPSNVLLSFSLQMEPTETEAIDGLSFQPVAICGGTMNATEYTLRARTCTESQLRTYVSLAVL